MDTEVGHELVARLRSLTPLHWLGIGLSTISGGVHLWLAVTDGGVGLLVASLGFAVGIGAVVADLRREAFVRLGIPFVCGQLLLYVVAHGFLKPSAPTATAIGLADKAIQLLLLAVLVALYRRQ